MVYRQDGALLQLPRMETVEWTLGDVVAKLREKRGWQRDDLAREARVSYATITRLETGSEMKEASIRAVAAALNVTLAELYALVPLPPTADELVRIVRGMKPESQEKALDLLRHYRPADAARDQARTPSPLPAHLGKVAGRGRGTKR